MENEVDVTILPRREDLVAWLVYLVSVIFLLLWDVWKALKRRAPWIPGQALVLSALVIQLLSFIDYSHISLYSGSRYETKEVVATLVKNQLVIDSGRLMMCVLIAYFLPGMARSGSISVGSNLTALALSIAFQVFSELRSVWTKGSDRIIFDVCSTILILAIIYLLVRLIKAVMSGRSIRRIMSQKIPSAITPCDRPSYNDIKNHVLKCWLVARFSQPDYVLVRIGLCSMVFPVVTVCIGVHVFNWTYVQFTDNGSLSSGTKRTLVQFVIVGQCLIVLIGWIVLLVRWVTSHMQGDTSRSDYFYSIEDSQIDLTAFLIRLFVRDKRIQEKAIRDLEEKFLDISSLLWIRQHWLKKLFQFFSMLNLSYWLTPIQQMLSRIKITVFERVRSIAVPDDRQFSMYEETLKMLLIPGESASLLWMANQWGFRKVEGYMDQGQEAGKRSPDKLICLLRLQTGTTEGEVGISAKEAKAHLQQANEKSWKRTAVSLIHFMIYAYHGSDASVIEDAMQCYIQAWEYMNFVDGLNEKVKSLGRQADKEFDSLQHSWHNRAQPEMLETKIKRPLRDQLVTRSNEERRNLQNFRDWTEVANNCLFQTWTFINPYLSAPQINKIHLLRGLLAAVYFSYMTEDVNKAALQKCSKLAEEGMEEEILDVAFLLAKAQGVLDKVRERNDPVEPPRNTDQGSASSRNQTENEPVGEGNDLPNNTDQGSISSPSENEIELSHIVVDGNDPTQHRSGID